jgi:sensor histidine kinase YesM
LAFVLFEIIEVIAMCQEGYLQTEVADNGPVQNAVFLSKKLETKEQTAFSYTGVGIKSIIERLKFLYPDKHCLKIIYSLIVGYYVQVFIPMEPL